MAEGFVHTVHVNGRWINSLEDKTAPFSEPSTPRKKRLKRVGKKQAVA